MSYRTYQTTNGPPWMLGSIGLPWQASLGSVKDTLAGSLRTAIKYRFPSYADSEALGAIGADRLLERAPGESDADYAARLRGAWDAWARAGTPLGLLLAFEVYFPGIPIALVQQAGWAYTLDTNTTLAPESRLILSELGPILGEPGWWFDANGGLPPSEGFWSRFGVLFYDSADLPTGWAAGAVSPPTSVSTPTLNTVNSMIRLVQLWKPAKATCEWIKVVTSGGGVWGYPPTDTWGMPGDVWGGDAVVTWNGQTLYT